jgi:arylsulfatase A
MSHRYAACDFVGRTRRGLFGDALAEVDHAVDTLAGANGQLRALGLEQNTLVLFASDK